MRLGQDVHNSNFIEFLFELKNNCLLENRNHNCSNFKIILVQIWCTYIYSRSLLDTATWPCQVKEYKIVSEPSLLTGWLAGWLAVLSTSFPISGPQTRQNPATRLRLSLKDGNCNSRFRPVTVTFCGFFYHFQDKNKV